MRRIGLPLDHVSTTLDIRAVLNAALTARLRPTLWDLRWSIRPRRRHLVVDGAHSRAFDVGQTAASISPTGWHRPGRVIRRRSCLVTAAASHPPLLELARVLSLVRLFGLSRAFTRYGERLIAQDVTLRLEHQLRCCLYAGLMQLSPGQLLDLHPADLLTRLVGDVEEVQTAFQLVLAPMLLAMLTLFAGGPSLWLVDPVIATVAVLTQVVVGPPGAALSLWRTSRLQADHVTHRVELTIHTADLLDGLPELLAFDHAPEWQTSNAPTRMSQRGGRHPWCRSRRGGLRSRTQVFVSGRGACCC